MHGCHHIQASVRPVVVVKFDSLTHSKAHQCDVLFTNSALSISFIRSATALSLGSPLGHIDLYIQTFKVGSIQQAGILGSPVGVMNQMYI